jgi:hypothetical protein
VDNPIIEARREILKIIVLDINSEKIRLSNIKPENTDLGVVTTEEDTKILEAKNNAKLLVLRQLFGYDCIQGILDEALREEGIVKCLWKT